MRKALLAISILVATGTATAEYTIKVPLEQNQGGQLPNSSIRITSNWSNAPTVYGEWIDQGQPYDCNNWFPADSTVPMGETFTQTATDCSQDQTRTAQDQEVETISGIVRDKGEPYTQSRTITVSSTRDSIGTLDHSWEAFADARGLSKNWNSLSWFNNTITHLPSLPYPVTNAYSLTISATQIEDVGGLIGLTNIEYLGLYNNNLKNVNGLINLRSLTNLTLHNNSLTNINGLANLTEVTNTLTLNNNQLTEVDSLINLQIVGFLNLGGNPLNNINGLANIVLTQRVFITDTYSGPKLPANSRFCTLNTEARFPAGASKSQLCET